MSYLQKRALVDAMWRDVRNARYAWQDLADKRGWSDPEVQRLRAVHEALAAKAKAAERDLER